MEFPLLFYSTIKDNNWILNGKKRVQHPFCVKNKIEIKK
jgi:hypothetical protein